MSTLIEDGAVVLFQGDSITDCGRDRDNDLDLGSGYPNMVAAWFTQFIRKRRLNLLTGNKRRRVKDLVARWKEDCIDLKPTWVSILIGVNDCWRRYDSNDPTSVDDFASGYRKILTQIRDNLDARIILCEPFVLPVPEDRKQWREDIDPKIHAVRELAMEYNTLYIPLDGIFAAASAKREPAFWAPDGVHPSQAGHALIARAWLETVKASV